MEPVEFLDELEDIAKREPWHDDNADWDRRVEALRLARQIELMSDDVGQPHVPLMTYEEAEEELRHMALPRDSATKNDDDKLQNFYIKELQEAVSRVSGFLFGSNGEGGSIRRIEDNLLRISQEMKMDREERHVKEAETAKLLTTLESRVSKNEYDINNLGHKMRGGESIKKAFINAVAGGVVVALLWALFRGVQYYFGGA
jgi:hypothetical protein